MPRQLVEDEDMYLQHCKTKTRIPTIKRLIHPERYYGCFRKERGGVPVREVSEDVAEYERWMGLLKQRSLEMFPSNKQVFEGYGKVKQPSKQASQHPN